MQHGFEVDVAMRDSGMIVQGERRDWVIDTGVGRIQDSAALTVILQCVVFANIAVSQNRLQIPAKKSISI